MTVIHKTFIQIAHVCHQFVTYYPHASKVRNSLSKSTSWYCILATQTDTIYTQGFSHSVNWQYYKQFHLLPLNHIMFSINNKPSNMNSHIHSIHLLTVRCEWSVQALYSMTLSEIQHSPGKCHVNVCGIYGGKAL